MLAVWMRMKFPHIVDGVIAASAPVWSFYGEVCPRCGLQGPHVAYTQGSRASSLSCVWKTGHSGYRILQQELLKNYCISLLRIGPCKWSSKQVVGKRVMCSLQCKNSIRMSMLLQGMSMHIALHLPVPVTVSWTT